MNYAQELAEFVVRTRYDDLPEYAIHNAKLCILNWIGITIKGSCDDSVSILLKALDPGPKQGPSTVFGKGIKTSMINASLINGYMSDVLNFDDVDLKSRIRPSIPMVSALLATGEYFHIPGKVLLLAYLVGYEVEVRVARAVFPSHYDIGWHVTGTAGTFGAAAGTSKVFRLDTEKTVYALGLAGTQAAGLRAVFASMSKAFHSGKASANGLLATLLAKEGFTSAQDILGAKRGFINVFSDHPHLDLLIKDLGKEFLIKDIMIKAYASGYYAHPGIDAALILKKKHGIHYEDIDEIEIEVTPLVAELINLPDPPTTLEANVSLQHSLAAAFIYGKAGRYEYSNEVVRKPELISLRRKVKLIASPDLEEIQTNLKIKMRDGRSFCERVDHPKGSPENPLTNSEVEQKFIDLTDGILSKSSQERIIDDVMKLERREDTAEIVSLCG